MTRFSLAALAFALTLAGPAPAESFREAFPDLTAQLDPALAGRIGALDLKHGTMALPGGVAEVTLPEGFYGLAAADAQYVIGDLWGNPADTTVLGLILKAGTTPLDPAAWAVVLQYDPIGHVSDDDAGSIDFASLLADMQAGTEEENAARRDAGFPAMELVGWAEPPHYDAAERKLFWAKRLRFEGDAAETLNYNIRVLGRQGVMVANFVAGMDQLAEVQAAAPAVLKMIAFTSGNRYADFDPGIDTVAAVGIGGLIAGKLAAKAGMLVLLLAFLKKGGILLLLPLLWLGRLFRRRGTGS
jgi:uncharacterized membrane-anchored protein